MSAADPLPSTCARIIIVGAGGFGREVCHWARDAWPAAAGRIEGFLSADPDRLAGRDDLPGILGTPDDFQLRPGDGLLLAIGIPAARRRVAEALRVRGGRFLTLVHPTAIVLPGAVVGPGSVICPGAVVSDAVRLGRCVLLNYHASLGHDAVADDFAVVSPYATLGGGARIADDVFLGLHATVAPGVSVGARSKLAAGAVAMHDVPPDHLVFGVPGTARPLVAPAD